MTRRGSHAVYLDIDHSDIEEFLEIKDVGNPIQSLFYGVSVPDYWMEEMIDGDKHKRNIWAKVLESRKNKGLPYIFFKDNVNKGKPQVYKDLNEEVVASNLCFLGDTLVNTDQGLIPIKDLYEKHLNGLKFTTTSIDLDNGKLSTSNITNVIQTKKTNKFTKVFIDQDGSSITTTPDHRYLTSLGGKYQWVEASDLYPGCKLVTVDGVISVIKVSTYVKDESEWVYDLTVDHKDHSFPVSFRNVFVHNCTEIALPSHENESFVCCLASLNLAKYDEWKDTDVVSRVVYFLDAVMQDFIDKTEGIRHMEDVRRFAMRHRSLGIGSNLVCQFKIN